MHGVRLLKFGARRGMTALFLVLAVLVFMVVYGLSGFFVGQSIQREVAFAEAGRTVRLVVDSCLDEALEGFLGSINIAPKMARTKEQRLAARFGQSIRALSPGQVTEAQFSPSSSGKMAKGLDVDIESTTVRATMESAISASGEISKEQCKKLKEVMDKWAKVGT